MSPNCAPYNSTNCNARTAAGCDASAGSSNPSGDAANVTKPVSGAVTGHQQLFTRIDQAVNGWRLLARLRRERIRPRGESSDCSAGKQPAQHSVCTHDYLRDRRSDDRGWATCSTIGDGHMINASKVRARGRSRRSGRVFAKSTQPGRARRGRHRRTFSRAWEIFAG